MVVAQLVEQLVPTPEVHGSNPIIGKIYIERCLSIVLDSKIKEKEVGYCPLKIESIITIRCCNKVI